MRTVKYAYSPGYAPCPGGRINLCHSDLEERIDGPSAVIDTGADQTVVPLVLLESINAVKIDELEVLTYDNRQNSLPTYRIRLQVHDFEPLVIEVIGSKLIDTCVLGRDVLNRYKILLDGPNLKMEITGE